VGGRRPVLHRVPRDLFNELHTDVPTFVGMTGFRPDQVVWLTDQLPWARERPHKVSPINSVCLFLHRLRRAVCAEDSAVLFGVCVATAHNVFHEVLDMVLEHEPWAVDFPPDTVMDTLVQIMILVRVCVCLGHR